VTERLREEGECRAADYQRGSERREGRSEAEENYGQGRGLRKQEKTKRRKIIQQRMGEKRRRKKAGNKARYFRAIQVTGVTAGETKEKHGINFRRSGMGVKRTKRMGVKGKTKGK